MPLHFWGDAFHTVVFLINRLPTPLLHGNTPFFTLKGKSPSYSHLRVFGAACYPCLRPYQQHKFNFHTERCLFLGYSDQHKGYRCLNSHGCVYTSRHVTFNETFFPYVSMFPSSPSPFDHLLPAFPRSSLLIPTPSPVSPVAASNSPYCPSPVSPSPPSPASHLPSSPVVLTNDPFPSSIHSSSPFPPLLAPNHHSMVTRHSCQGRHLQAQITFHWSHFHFLPPRPEMVRKVVAEQLAQTQQTTVLPPMQIPEPPNQNKNQGLNVADLSTEAKHLRDFRKYSPPTLVRELDNPTKAEQWLSTIETIFRYMKCREDQKLQCAVFSLTDGAQRWWRSAKRMIVIDGSLATWDK